MQSTDCRTRDYRADLYSLGATLFKLLCGRAPLAATPDLSPLTKLRLLATSQPPSLRTLRPDAPPACHSQLRTGQNRKVAGDRWTNFPQLLLRFWNQ